MFSFTLHIYCTSVRPGRGIPHMWLSLRFLLSFYLLKGFFSSFSLLLLRVKGMSHLVKALWDELWFVNMGYTNKIWLIILTFTVNTSKPPRMGRWGQESSVRGTTSGFHSSLHSVSLSFALSMSLSSRGKSALELALSSSSRRVYTGRWSAVLRRATLSYALR